MLSQLRGHNLESFLSAPVLDPFTHLIAFAQFVLSLRRQVALGAMTQQQAREHLTRFQLQSHPFQDQNPPQQLPPGFPSGMPSGTSQQQMPTFPQRAQVPNNNQINPLQRVIQAQDPSHARNMLLAQNQQQQNSSGFTSLAAQNVGPAAGMGLPQGPGSLQQNFVQPSPSVPHANAQPSSAPSGSQAPLTGGQQVPSLSGNLADLPLPQLRNIYAQLMRAMMEGEKNFQAASSSSGDSEMQRQLQNKLEVHKQRLRALQDLIHAKLRARYATLCFAMLSSDGVLAVILRNKELMDSRG